MSDPRVSTATRRTVIRRAGSRCEYCRCPEGISPSPFCVEHVHPRVAGGDNRLSNLAFACAGCNGHKAGRIVAVDLVSQTVVALFHPRKDRWTDHFSWSADAADLIGLTPAGRATVAALRLNRDKVRHLRRLLAQLELHPPT